MPEWYLILEACPLLGSKPWEFDDTRSPLYWMEAALAKLGAERWAQAEAHRLAKLDMDRRRTRGRWQ